MPVYHGRDVRRRRVLAGGQTERGGTGGKDNKNTLHFRELLL
jgi:hypothetical protein